MPIAQECVVLRSTRIDCLQMRMCDAGYCIAAGRWLPIDAEPRRAGELFLGRCNEAKPLMGILRIATSLA